MAHEEERHDDVSQADLLSEGDWVSSTSNNSRTTQQQQSSSKGAAVAAATAAAAHHAHPRPPSAQQLRQGSTVRHDEQRYSDVPDEVTL